jgi:hypothetical protein
MKDLINTLLSTYPWFNNKKETAQFSTESAYQFCKDNKLEGAKMKDREGIQYRISLNTYYYEGKPKNVVWINKISEQEVDNAVMASRFSAVE